MKIHIIPGMNQLDTKARAQILRMLCEGSSMRSVSRIADVSINTVSKLLEDAGEACLAYHDENVRNVPSKHVQCDEVWSFVYAKQENVAAAKDAPEDAGDAWTWTALDADTKLIVSYLVGGRDAGYAHEFMQNVASRLANRLQLATDGLKDYLSAVDSAFDSDIDYAQLVKMYSHVPSPADRYGPAECTGAVKVPVEGRTYRAHISTSYVERSNLTMRMSMRRFTQLTNGFSKKVENHIHMVSPYTFWYNFVRMHKTLKCTPAMAAGLSRRLWSMEDVVKLTDARAKPVNRPTVYKVRNSN